MLFILPIIFTAYSDEVGFIHPSQFAALNGEAPSVPSLFSRCDPQPADGITIFHASEFASDMFFWNREHKLGISTLVILPLYTAAKDAFMEAHKQYTMLSYLDGQKDQSETATSHDIVESQVMKHSRALLLLSSDFGTAWNSRSLVFRLIYADACVNLHRQVTYECHLHVIIF